MREPESGHWLPWVMWFVKIAKAIGSAHGTLVSEKVEESPDVDTRVHSNDVVKFGATMADGRL